MGIFGKKDKKGDDDLARRVEEYNQKILSGSSETRAEEPTDDLAQLVEKFNSQYNPQPVKQAATTKRKGSSTEPYAEYFPDLNRSYKVFPNQLELARDVVEAAEFYSQGIIKGVHQFRANGVGPLNEDGSPQFENLEDLYRGYLYQGLIKIHLQYALYGMPQILETVLALCDQEGKQHLKAFISMADLKPLLAYAFDKLIVPIAKGSDPLATAHAFTINMPSWIRVRSIDPNQWRVENLAEADYSDAGILDNFNKTSRFFQSGFFAAFTESKHLSAFINDPDDGLSSVDANYKNTWVSTNLTHALKSVKRLGYNSFTLDQYPNQGLNIAALFLFCMHQINNDMITQDSGGNILVQSYEKRYDYRDIAAYPQESQMMASQAGAYVFERLI